VPRGVGCSFRRGQRASLEDQAQTGYLVRPEDKMIPPPAQRQMGNACRRDCHGGCRQHAIYISEAGSRAGSLPGGEEA